jgi:hypothetical protein
MKTILEDKITRQTIAEFQVKLTEKSYLEILTELCHSIDIPTPATIKYHYNCFNNFNSVTYRPADFVESVDFDSLILENCIEKK